MLIAYSLLLVMIIPFNWAELKIYQESKSVIAFKNFASNLKIKLQNQHNFVAITGTNKECSRDISDWDGHTFPVIITNKISGNDKGLAIQRHVRSKLIINFLDNVEEISKILDNLNRYAFSNLHANIFFIICNPIESANWIEEFGEQIWQKRILNFFMVFYTTQLEVITYNPFADVKIINYTNIPITYSDLFDNKVRNLNGYQLHSGIVVDYPRIVHKHGKYYGKDVKFMSDIIQHINATLDISIAPNNSYIALHENIKRGVFDFSSLSKFNFKLHEPENILNADDPEFTYPFTRDGYTIIAPKGKLRSPYLNLLYTFDICVWILITVVTISITCEIYLMDKILKCPKRDDPFVQTLRIFVNLPTPELAISITSKKYLIAFAIWFSVIINIAFQSSLTSALVKSRYDKDIDTLEELEESRLNILVTKGFIDIVPHTPKLYKQFVYGNQSESVEMLLDGNTDYAYGINSLESAQIIVDRTRQKFGKDMFKVVGKPLIPGYRGYVFSRNSPYLDVINKLLLLCQESGLPHDDATDSERRKVLFPEMSHFTHNSTYIDNTGLKLSLSHLQTAFYILIIGFFIASLTLFYEIILNKKNRQRVDSRSQFVLLLYNEHIPFLK